MRVSWSHIVLAALVDMLGTTLSAPIPCSQNSLCSSAGVLSARDANPNPMMRVPSAPTHAPPPPPHQANTVKPASEASSPIMGSTKVHNDAESLPVTPATPASENKRFGNDFREVEVVHGNPNLREPQSALTEAGVPVVPPKGGAPDPLPKVYTLPPLREKVEVPTREPLSADLPARPPKTGEPGPLTF